MNHDDDFFRLPKARASARREPEIESPATAPVTSAAGKPDAAEPKEIAQAAPSVASSPVPAASPVTAAVQAGPMPEPGVAPTAEPSPPAPAEVPEARPLPKPKRAASPAPPPAPPPPKPGGKNPSRPAPWLWPVFGVGVVGVIVIGGLLGYWAFMHVAVRLLLTDQPLTIQLPPQADIVMRTDHKIDVLMKGTIYAQVPLVQTLDLPVKGTYDTIVDIDTKVPLETVITYEGIIPVDSIAEIEAKAPVNFQNVKKFKNLHFKAKLPLKLRLPVKLVVPVKQDIPLKYHGPLRIKIDHVIKAPVNTTLKTALKVNQQFSIPITTSVPMRLALPQHPVKATIVESDLNLDLATLRLERKPVDEPSTANP